MSYTSTNTITIIDGSINTVNYAGNFNQDIFSNTSIINSFTNSGIILGGGGYSYFNSNLKDGKNGLINSGSINIITNTGAFLGGGGASSGSHYCLGGAGGGGGGSNGGYYRNKGGSLAYDVNVNDIGNPGAGPGGNVTTKFSGYQGGTKFGPFGGGGVSYYESYGQEGSISNGMNGTIDSGGNGGNVYNGSGNTYNGGGGGYGGGNGGYIINTNVSGFYIAGGGGGGGGGQGGQIINSTSDDSVSGGNGGYSIYNSGTITTLVNSQGGLISNTDPNNYPYGPLFYAGVAPTNYNILINSTTQYGQLWCTGVTDTTGNITFGIADGSILNTGTYSSVLKFNTGTVTLNNTSGTYQNYSWSLVQNGLYYDLVLIYSAPCFKIGSKILTDKGYQLIENLRNGDLVKTLKNGYLPIVIIGKSEIYNSGNEERIKNRLYNLSCKNYPELIEDLVLTGCHSILVDTLTLSQATEIGGEKKRLYITDNKLRLFCYLDLFSDPYNKEGTFTIYHIALENENYYGNYGIYANGLLVESCSIRYLKELSNMILIE